MEKEKNNLIYITIGAYLLTFIASIILKVNFIILLSVAIVGVAFTLVALNDEKILIISGVLISFLYYGLKDISGIFQYMPLYITALMIIDILIKNKKFEDDMVLKYLISLSLVLGILPLILNFDINITNIIYALLKRYSFIIIYIYIKCSSLDYINIDQILSFILKVVLLINLPIFVVQFIQGVDRDFICGMFGDNMTGIICQLFLIQLCIKLKDYYYEKVTTINMFAWVIITVVYSSIAEVKFGFFVAAIFLAVFFIFIERKLKSVIIIAVLGVLFVVGYLLYMQTYSQQNFLDKDFVRGYLVEQNYSGDSINRFGFVKKIDNAMSSTTVDKLIGGGIGSGNPSNFKFLRGSLNRKYDSLKYYWFSIPYLYVETGFIGTTIMLLIYIYIFIISYLNFKNYNSELSLLAFLISIVNFMFIIYSDTLVNYTTLFITWAYFALSIKEVKEGVGEEIYE